MGKNTQKGRKGKQPRKTTQEERSDSTRQKERSDTEKNLEVRADSEMDQAVRSDSMKIQEEMQKALDDFTCRENWDQFFTIRGSDDSFEWYAEWSQLKSLLTTQLSFQSKEQSDSPRPPGPAEVSILVPGCGNSKLSESLYDAGFKNITNIDFSKVVISNMLSKNVRERPEMKWRVMDMTKMQFAEETFDAVVDKGGLDALMEPKLGPQLGYLYLFEVKRVIKVGGKYVCLTLAEAHILDLLLPIFRFGWKMSLYAMEPYSRNLKLQTFMVVAERDSSTAAVSDISLFMDKSDGSPDKQAHDLHEALERERKIRSEYSNGSDIFYSLQDLHLGAKGNIQVLEPGRRITVILGGPGVSHFIYNGILLDAKKEEQSFAYHYGVFIVPHHQSHDWLFSSEEGQQLLLASSNAARLLMIILDSSNSNADMEYIQSDLSPLVKQLAPGQYDESVQIPFLASGDGMLERKIVHQVTSIVTGPIVVEDVVYQEIADDAYYFSGCKYRRLIFQRTENLVQSEALLLTKESSDDEKEQETSEPESSEKHIAPDSPTPSGELKVVHNHLASLYHTGIISGILLISSAFLKDSASIHAPSKVAVVGLGAGLLPMFMKNNLPSLTIEVAELDAVVVGIARKYFDLVVGDERLKVHVTDGIEFVQKKAKSKADGKVDILVVDVDSADTRCGMTCPAAAFVEESFLLAAKDSLPEQGLFIVNLVSRSSAVKDDVKSRMQKVFSNILSLQLEEDVNEVIFAVKSKHPMKEDQLSKARQKFSRQLLNMDNNDWKEKVSDLSEMITLIC